MALPQDAQVQFDGFGRKIGPLFSLARPRLSATEIGSEYAQSILTALECTRSGCPCHGSARRGRGRTHCPAHGDVGSPSLSVDPKENTTTWKCHTGCTQVEVLRALAAKNLLPALPERPKYNAPIRSAPVQPPQPAPPPVPQKGDPDYYGPDDDGVEYRQGAHLIYMNDGKWRWKGTGFVPSPEPEPMADPWDSFEEKTGLPREFMETLGVYHDDDMRAFVFPFDGLEVYKYRPWPEGQMKYGWPTGHKRPELWPLPEPDMQGGAIFLTAGETDCMTLRYHGYQAFAVTGGEAKPCPATALSDFKLFGVDMIYVCFDSDQPGFDGSQKQAACAYHAEFETYVLFPPLVSTRGKKDINDLHKLVKGNTEMFRKWFDAAVKNAYHWTPNKPGPYLRHAPPEAESPTRRVMISGSQGA